jgi:hypothetical protein
MRTDIHLQFICSRCGNALAIDCDNKSTRFEYHSAFNGQAVMAIIPCQYCIAVECEPARQLAAAVKQLTQDKRTLA